jgi:hypothetical protein
MNDKHPITPPPELVGQWREESSTGELHFSPQYLAVQAARWGADQELDACCKWLECNYNYPQANPLRIARRPKPPSLKEQALADLLEIYTSQPFPAGDIRFNCIRRALEELPE